MVDISTRWPEDIRIVRVRWEGRTVGFDNTGVESLVRKACSHFKLGHIDNQLMLVGEFEGEALELSDDMLQHLASGATISLTRIPVYSEAIPCSEPSIVKPSATLLPPGTACTMQIFVRTLRGRTVTITVSPDMSVRDVMEKIYKRENVPMDQQRLVYGRSTLACDRSLSHYNIQKESTLHLISVLKGGKPVIYLFPPRPFSDVTVSVRLAPQWSFSHIYPSVEVKALANDMQSISWSVSAGTDGILVDKRTNLELSYLFWEALSRPTTIPLGPPLNPCVIDPHAPTEEHFDPSHPSLQPDSCTAVMLPFSQLLLYMDTVLKDLTLHTSARNDFITYWLPALSKHPFVALRFLPQSAYERAAELEVSPAPDVITRVFMLFRGVAAEEVKEWEEARERVGKVDWRSVVGICTSALDMGRFRVLEWGGMEVL